jgi:hypothetical protein
MGLPDPERSAAAIIGVATYRLKAFPDLPAVTNNVLALSRILTHPQVGHLTQDRCHTILDPATPQSLIKRLRKIASEVEDTFVLYFAGHGELDRNGKLTLILKNTSPSDMRFSALDFESIRDLLIHCPARRRIVILDCCYSGSVVTEYMSGEDQGLCSQTFITGTCTIASADRGASIAPSGASYTAFTGELVRLLEDGLPGFGEYITIRQLFPALRRALEAAGYPKPAQRLTDDVSNLALTRNPMHVGTAATRQFSGLADHLANPEGHALADSWRARIDVATETAFVSSTPPLPRAEAGGCGAGLVGTLWAVASFVMTWHYWPSAVYPILLVSGLVALGLEAVRPPDSKPRPIGILAAVVQVAAYVTMAIIGGYKSHWGSVSVDAGLLLMYAYCVLGREYRISESQRMAAVRAREERKSESQRTAECIARSPIAQRLRTELWLGERAGGHLFDAASYIPGARFIQMRELGENAEQPDLHADPYALRIPNYAIACGANVVAIYCTEWESGVYRRMSVGTKELRRNGDQLYEPGKNDIDEIGAGLRALQSKIKIATILGLILITPTREVLDVKKKARPQGRPTTVEVSDQNMFKSDLVVTNESGAVQAVGSFLAEDPYAINLDVITRLLEFSCGRARHDAGLGSYGSRRLTA